MENAEIKREEANDEGHEHQPHPKRLAEKK
jgi:hypothetical protein